MIKDGTIVSQRDIVLIPFPHTNLKEFQMRPALVLSRKQYNINNNDFICCALTSDPKKFYYGIPISNKDLDFGNLNFESVIIPSKVFTSHKSSIIKRLGRININKSREVIRFLKLRIEIEE